MFCSWSDWQINCLRVEQSKSFHTFSLLIPRQLFKSPLLPHPPSTLHCVYLHGDPSCQIQAPSFSSSLPPSQAIHTFSALAINITSCCSSSVNTDARWPPSLWQWASASSQFFLSLNNLYLDPSLYPTSSCQPYSSLVSTSSRITRDPFPTSLAEGISRVLV